MKENKKMIEKGNYINWTEGERDPLQGEHGKTFLFWVLLGLFAIYTFSAIAIITAIWWFFFR